MIYLYLLGEIVIVNALSLALVALILRRTMRRQFGPLLSLGKPAARTNIPPIQTGANARL